MLHKNMLTALPILGLLAGCSGGGSGGGVDSLADVEDLGLALQATFGPQIDDGDYTPLASFPLSGEVNYKGAIGLGPPNLEIEDSLVVGEIDITHVLRTDAVSGTARNFFDSSSSANRGERLTGTLTLTSELDRSVDIQQTFGIDGELTGTLTDPDGVTGTFDYEVDADFFGAGAEFIYGEGDGTVLFSNESGPLNTSAVFLGERQ